MTRGAAGLAAALLLGALAAPADPAVRRLSVPNGSFEDGENFPDQWNSVSGYTINLDTGNVMDGGKSMHINFWESWVSNANVELNAGLLPKGKTVSLGAWMRVGNIGNSPVLRLKIRFEKEDASTSETVIYEATAKEEWTWRFKSGITVPEDLVKAEILVEFNNVDGHVDGIVMALGDELPPETEALSQRIALDSESLRAAIQRAREAMKPPEELDQSRRLELVSETKELIEVLLLLADQVQRGAEDLREAAGSDPLKLAKAGRAEDAAARAARRVREAVEELERAKAIWRDKTTLMETEALSAPVLDAALDALTDALAAVNEVEAAATEALVFAGTWGGGIFQLEWIEKDSYWNWKKVNRDPMPQPSLEYIAASPDGNLYAGGTDRHVYVSDSNGATWTPTGGRDEHGRLKPTLPADANGLAVDPADPDAWLLTSWGGGAWWSTTRGRSWTRGPSPPSSFLRGARAFRSGGVAAPLTSFYAIADGETVLSTTTFGGRWTETARMPRGIRAWDLAPKPRSPGTLLAATDAGVAEISPDGKLTFPDFAVPTRGARSLAAAADKVLIGTDGHGIVMWKIPESGNPTSNRENAGLANKVVYAMAYAPHPKPKSASQDLQPPPPRFWTSRSNGLENLIINCIAVNPKDEQVLYCSTEGGFHYSLDRGANWERSIEGLKSNRIGRLAVDPGNPDIIYVAPPFIDVPTGVHKSTDGGKTWSEVNEGLTTPTVMWVALDPGAAWEIYAATWGGGIFRSQDSAATWAPFSQGLPNQFAFLVILERGKKLAGLGNNAGLYLYGSNNAWETSGKGLSSGDVWHVASDPHNDGTWLLGTAGGGLYKSEDDAVSWRPILGVPTQDIYRIAYHPKKPGVVYFGSRPRFGGTGAGVFRSVDGGETWTADNDGLTSLLVGDLTISKEGVVYLGTRDGLYYKLD